MYRHATGMDFTIHSLSLAIDLMEVDLGKEASFRLIVGTMYEQRSILEVIFTVRGKLDIPFERSYCLDSDAWMLVADNGSIFYAPGG